MPELPEVETIRRGLDRRLRGARILGVEIREPRLRRVVDAAGLRALVGRQVEGVGRGARYLLAESGGGWVWRFHLAFSARWVSGPAGTRAGPPGPSRVPFAAVGALG